MVDVSASTLRRLHSLWPLGLLSVALVALRWGTYTVPPTWDAAMSVWPAGIEIAARNSVTEVLQLPSYADGGPNTHTLSLVTLLTALLIEIGGVDFAVTTMHVLNTALLLGLGFLVARTVSGLASKAAGWLTASIVVLFPLMVSQSAYLYTELPTAFFVFLALAFAMNRRPLVSTLSLTVAILIKPLALVAVPALCLVAWRKGGKRREIAAPLLALVGLVPVLIVPQPEASRDIVESLTELTRLSWYWATTAPELILLTAIPVIAALVLRLRGGSKEQWHWAWASTTLIVTFIGFFTLNAVVTVGHFFLPRYFVMLIAPTMVLLAIAVSGLRTSAQVAVLSFVIAGSLIGVRGPFALGSKSPLPPVAERSLAFIDLLGEHQAGLDRLAAIGSAGIPVFHDQYASYAYSYPEMGLHAGEVQNATRVLSGDLRAGLAELPDRFAMLITVPFLGGERLFWIKGIAESDPNYRVSVEQIESARAFPLEIVSVDRVKTSG